MRLIAVTLVTLLLGFAHDDAQADPYPWCAVYLLEDGGATNCYFLTLPQCQATVSGIGGFCTHNNFYDGRPVTTNEEAGSRRARKRELH